MKMEKERDELRTGAEGPDKAAVKVNDAIKIYKTGELEVVALSGLNLEVSKGEFVAIMGPSGCGKTTLLNLIGGMDRPTAGSIIVNNTDLSELDTDQACDFRANTVGFVFQFFNLLPELTARENVELPTRISNLGRKERETRAQKLLELVDLEERGAHKPSQLSGGEQQRIAIAAALANHPPILLADEPTGELDSEAGAGILDLLRKLSKEEGRTIIAATHDIRVARYADRVLRILDGEILTQGPEDLTRLSQEASQREEIEQLRNRVSELTDTLTRIRQSLAKT
jgi:putative ABC transport system ATP-binding protein